MARVVYGVSGEGSGHSSRARVVARHLEKQGHELKLISYDRGFQNLKEDFDVFETEGLRISSRDNKIDAVATFTENIKRLPLGFEKAKAVRRRLFYDFKPHIVLTDFEPLSAYFGHHYNLPIVTVDNQHRMRYMEYGCPPGLKKEQVLTENIIRAMVPKPDVSLVLSFFKGRPTNDRVFFFDPILREEVRNLKSMTSDYVLCYLTSGFDSLLPILKEFPQEKFVIYGYNKEEQSENIRFKPFSKTGFLEDLRQCKAVVATAGFTLISECLYLHKPYYALPMAGQFEQALNAFQLEHMGYGKNGGLHRDALAAFFYDLPYYKSTLKHYHNKGNTALLDKLDHLLENNGKLLKYHHDNRERLSKMTEK